MEIIDGKKISENIYSWISEELNKQEKPPKLAIIQATNDPASLMYVRMKTKKAEELGIEFQIFPFDELTSADQIIYQLHELNTDPSFTGVMIQLPLYPHLEKDKDLILNIISSHKDIDGLTYATLGKIYFYQNNNILPATVDAILECLRFSTDNNLFELKGKNILIVNNSNLIGKPLGVLLSRFNATVTLANEFTENLSNLTQNADIIVSATGKTNLIEHTMVKDGSTLIDVTSLKVITPENPEGKIMGDFANSPEFFSKAAFVTPVPGGVGPLTIACLFRNLINLSLGSSKSF